jgi:hypothetical protein
MKKIIFILLLISMSFCYTQYYAYKYINYPSKNIVAKIPCRYVTYDQRNVILLIPKEQIYKIEKAEILN